MTGRRLIGPLAVALLAAACAKPQQPAPRSPAAVVDSPPPPAPEPPQACYSRDEAPTSTPGDVATTDDPKRSVFVLDREMLPELGRRLDHPSGAQKHSSLDKAIVEMVARRHADEVKSCYKALLAAAPEKSGTVTARLVVGADGQVSHARVIASTLQDASSEDCVGRSVCGWRFPALAQGHALVLEYPFLLSPP